MSWLSDPQAFAHSLHLELTEDQDATLQRFADDETTIDVSGSVPGNAEAIALGVLWRLMVFPDSRVLVVSASRPLGRAFMRILHILTTVRDPILGSICHWKRHYRMYLGSNEDHGVFWIHNRPEFVQDWGKMRTSVVVLGARNADFDFEKTEEALEPIIARPYNRLIRLW